jgi:hypothetical protein
MSVKELQALTQKFADAFDQRDLQAVMERCFLRTWRCLIAFPVGSTASRSSPSISTRPSRASSQRAENSLLKENPMSAYLVFTRTRTLDQKELEQATSIPETFCSFVNESARCGKSRRRYMRPSTRWTESARRSSADIRSMGR